MLKSNHQRDALTHTNATGSFAGSQSEYDDVTNAFLDDASPRLHSGPDRPEVELLIAGHLPVFGTAWVTRYALDVSRSLGDGPVGLVRQGRDSVSVEVISGSSMRARPNEPYACDMKAAIEGVSVRRWVVHCDLESALRAALADHALRPLARLTILTSADQAAIVAAYGLLKQLHAEPDADAGNAHGMALGSARFSHVRLAFMGAEKLQALAAADRVRGVCRAFLPAAASCSFCAVPRIEACSPRVVFRGASGVRLEDTLQTLLAPRVPRDVGQAEHDTDEPPLPTPVPTPVAPELPAQSPRVPLVVPAGLTLIAHHCPSEPAVLLAHDSEGVLHLVTEMQPQAHDPVGGMLAVASWASQHAGLLRAACPELNASDDPPTLHLIADTFTALRRYSDCGVQLHLRTGATLISLA